METVSAEELVKEMLARVERLELLLWESHSLQAIRLGTIVEEGLNSLAEELREGR